ncbi:PilZ domain-containing protein [bacterium]|nr:PilZ domain-containing protein [bacterium]
MLSLPDPCDTAFLNELLTRNEQKSFSERRRHARRLLNLRAQLVPLTLDGPDFTRAIDVTTEDVSQGGASVLAPRPPLGPRWSLALPQGESRVIMELAIRDLRRTPTGPFRVACQFVRRVPHAA